MGDAEVQEDEHTCRKVTSLVDHQHPPIKESVERSKTWSKKGHESADKEGPARIPPTPGSAFQVLPAPEPSRLSWEAGDAEVTRDLGPG